jgi:predicted DNA-binding antitoxin AbrB/MazE fold protein
MVESFKAVYENGILRPLAPLDLKEQELVSLAVVRAPTGRDLGHKEDQDDSVQHRNLLVAFVEKMEATNEESPPDGFTNRDHDRLIYGQ